ncbi:MAG: hypothetical protein ABI321_19210 [Polyangia bacterium]
MRRAVLYLVVVVWGAGCATSRPQVPVGVTHTPYAGLPEYLVSPAQQRYDELMKKLAARRNSPGTAPLHVSAPAPADAAPAEDAAPGEEAASGEEAAPADTAETEPEPIQPGGSLSVTIPDPQPQENRKADLPNAWQPSIITPNP